MRTIVALPVLLVACSGVALAAGGDRSAPPRYFLESRDPSSPVVYRFAVASERRDPAADQNGDGAPQATASAPPEGGGPFGGFGGGRRPRGAPASIEPQSIRFANVDPKHVKLTILDASNADTAQTLIADRTPDGQLHAKLERGSLFAIPLALYDRVTVLASAGSGAVPEVPTDAKIQPLASTDAVDGTLRVHAGSAAHVVFDGAGSVTPSFDLFASGRPPGGGPGAPGGPGGSRGVRGGMGGGGFGGMRGGRGGSERSSIPADATLHVDAVFDRFALARADGTETLAFGDTDAKRERTWSIVRVP